MAMVMVMVMAMVMVMVMARCIGPALCCRPAVGLLVCWSAGLRRAIADSGLASHVGRGAPVSGAQQRL